MIKQFILSLLLVSSISVTAHDPLLDSAKTFYDQANYEKTINCYTEILQKGFESGELRYNLANAYYRTNQIGQSILNYEKALKLLPGNEDILFNLATANSKKRDKFDQIPDSSISGLLNSINKIVSFEIWAILSTILFIGSATFFYISKKIKSNQITKYAILTMGIGILFGFFSLQQKKSVTNSKFGVVLNNKSNILSEPNSNSTILLEVNEGSKLKIIRTDGNWINISTPGNDKGWIELENISEI